MSIFLHGFPTSYADALLAEGFDVSYVVAPDAPAGANNALGVQTASAAERYAFKDGAFAPGLPADLARRVRHAHLSSYHRTHAREFFREHAGRADWLEISDYFENAIQYYYEILTKRKIDTIIFHIVPHEGSTTVLLHLAKAMGVRTVICYQSETFHDRFWISSDYRDLGRSAITTPPDIPPRRIPIQSEPKPPVYMRNVVSGSHWRWYRFAAEEVGRFVLRVLIFQFITNRRAFAKKYYKLQRQLQLFEHQYQLREEFETDIPTGDFIYFPLHLQPEATTDVMGGEYADQLLAVEELARALPDHVAICVKENPKQTALMRGESFFKRIKAIPNTRLLHSSVSTYELMRRSRAVATVSGTAGWEALQIGKPAIAFGFPWWRGIHGAFEWTELGPSAATQALAFTPDPEKLQSTASEKGERLWPGVVNLYYAQHVPSFEPQKNFENVVKSLSAYLRSASQTGAARSVQESSTVA